jgi:predicted nucleic acid-binding protein
MEVIQKALKLNSKYGYSYYDCLILASALLNDCEYLYSEDMQHNQLIEGKLKIVNPFL